MISPATSHTICQDQLVNNSQELRQARFVRFWSPVGRQHGNQDRFGPSLVPVPERGRRASPDYVKSRALIKFGCYHSIPRRLPAADLIRWSNPHVGVPFSALQQSLVDRKFRYLPNLPYQNFHHCWTCSPNNDHLHGRGKPCPVL